MLEMQQLVRGYLLTINCITFAYWGIDKWIAVYNGKHHENKKKKQLHRVSEKQLLLLAILGGGLGSLLGMSLFRHKISKGSFLWKLLAVVGVWCLIVAVIVFW